MAEIKRISLLVPLTSVIIVQEKEITMTKRIFWVTLAVTFFATILGLMLFFTVWMVFTRPAPVITVVAPTPTATEFGAHPRVIARVTLAPTATPTPTVTATRPSPTVTPAQTPITHVILPICPQTPPFPGIVVTNNLNLRQGPNMSFPLVQFNGRGIQLRLGQTFAAMARNNNPGDEPWIYVTVQDPQTLGILTGWIKADHDYVVICGNVRNLPDP